jgi:CubicO group peptidase (beta-lactamase class C family)
MDNDLSPDEWIERLAQLPLIDQPGNAFHYGNSTDLLGFLMSRIEGAPLADLLEQRIFAPLGMKDTGFLVGIEMRDRRAALCGFDDEGRLTPLTTVPGNHTLPERPNAMTWASGGQGLWSTLDDYLAFARMFVDGGTVEGVRLLKPQTLSMMASNQLTESQRASAKMFGRSLFAAGHGYGFGVAVVTEPEKADPVRCGGGVGAVGWPGAYGGWWQADPNDGSVMVFLSHNMAELRHMAAGIGISVWGAISEFQVLATAALREM